MNINFKKLDSQAVTPTKAHSTDAGFDMTAISVSRTLNSSYIEYDTGIAVEIPEGYVGLLFPRSSISNYDLTLSNSVGIIDSNYRGPIKFRFKLTHKQIKFHTKKLFGFVTNITKSYGDYNEYTIGDKIGQLIILPYPEVQFTEVSTLSDSDRGEKGFGSTTPQASNKEAKITKKSKTKKK